MTNERKNITTVQSHDHGKTVAEFLAAKFLYHKPDQWRQLIDLGEILVNDAVVVNADYFLKKNDIVEYKPAVQTEPGVCRDYTIIYEDEWLIVANKPGDLPVHPAGKYFNNTLTRIIQKDCGNIYYPIHRLDRETSGIVVMAKNREVASKLQPQINTFHKEYIAICEGTVPKKEFTIDIPIGTAKQSVVRKKFAAYPGATQEAKTIFRLIDTYDDLSLIQALPETGRQHQIRVHLLAAGLPIIGDKLYGRDECIFLDFIRDGLTPEIIKRAGFTRTALHASRLVFHHPWLSRELELTAPIPEDMKGLLERQAAS